MEVVPFRILDPRLSGAGLDVWYKYPRSKEEVADTPPSEFPFGELDAVVMSPHRAGHVSEDMDIRARHLAELLNETGLTEIEIEKSGLKVRVARAIQTTAIAPFAAAGVAAPPAAKPADGSVNEVPEKND